MAARIWTWKSGSTGYLFLDDFCVTVPDSQAPTVPAGLSSASVTQTSFTLRWNAATDNVGVTAYEVFRGSTSLGTSSGTSFNVANLAAATTYAMRVRARDAAGNWSAQSAPLNVTTTGSAANFDVTINKSARNQTIDGFGFFGAQNTWWSGASSLWSDAWGDQVISDLGITIWRNEYYPPSDNLNTQDANWTKQRPVVQGLKRKADQYGVNLKFIFTVWSPPSSLKVRVTNNTREIGVPHPFGTKQGGALDPTRYGEFASWMAQGIENYRADGIEPYAVSPQNEPFFVQGFNSCWYKQEWYPEMLIGAMSILKANYPNVKVFGSEGMLEMEAADNNWQWFYHKQILDSAAGARQHRYPRRARVQRRRRADLGQHARAPVAEPQAALRRSDEQEAVDDRDVGLRGRLERLARRIRARPGHHVGAQQRQRRRLGVVAGQRESGQHRRRRRVRAR